MSEFDQVIREYLNEQQSMTHTAILGRITKVNENTADVQPLQGGFPLLKSLPLITHRYEYKSQYHFWDDEKEEWVYVNPADEAPIFHTEVLTVEGPVYEVGDIVLVVFLERARDGAGERMHGLEDGIVVGVVK